MRSVFFKKNILTFWVIFPLINGWAAESTTPVEIRSMPMESIVGSECPMTGVRVEQVDVLATAGEQRIVVSIPRATVAERPNLRLYHIDTRAFDFEHFKEIRDNRDPDRRSFAFVVKEFDRFQFKVGFDSAQ